MGLKISHAYYAGKLGDVVKEIVANGKNTLHYYWYPDPLVAQLGSQSISYPDYIVGCRVNYEQTKDPDVAELDCDFHKWARRIQMLLSLIADPDLCPEAKTFSPSDGFRINTRLPQRACCPGGFHGWAIEGWFFMCSGW